MVLDWRQISQLSVQVPLFSYTFESLGFFYLPNRYLVLPHTVGMEIKMEECSENALCGQKTKEKSVFDNIQKLPIFLGLVISHGNILPRKFFQ